MRKQLAILLLFPALIIAQERVYQRAEQKFEKESYVSAIKIYEHLVKKGVDSEQIYERLGDANYLNANYVEAAHWYGKRYNLGKNYPKAFLYRYGQSLKSVGKAQQSEEVLAQYAKENPELLSAKNSQQTKAQQSIRNGSDSFVLSNLNINSKYSDYSSTIKGDTLLFASARPSALSNQIYERTAQPFTDLYYSIKQTDGSYSKPELYSKTSFSIYHEASPIFTKDGHTMYYTQNELENNSKSKVVNGKYKIYKSVKENGKWKNMGVLPVFTDNTIRIAHPALSPDERTLYFVSDAPGSYGLSDLYKVALNTDGTLGDPINLGSTINTEGRESYPFVTSDNILLFASDVPSGLGGFDIFALDLNQIGSLPVRLSAPINSPFDDFGINWNRESNQGVFTSNRLEGQGDDDLYGFYNNSPIPFSFDYNARITGTLKDKESAIFIANATVVLYNNLGVELGKTTSDANGYFLFEKVSTNATYSFKIVKQNYLDNVYTKNLDLYEREVQLEILLDQGQESGQSKFSIGTDLAKALALRDIYFDLNKWNIRKDSKIELDKMAEVLLAHPTLRIAIGSHTDSRQSETYNQNLSEKRAQATLKYLVKLGIAKNRLTAKGYGETQLVNKCADSVPCSEAEHQENRRSTFMIVEN